MLFKWLLLVIAFLTGIVFSSAEEDAKLWAVLVAGSKGYRNYRHQADVCHAYHVLHNHGIPDEQIIVMMYDDIAHSSENPTPGIIINYPNGSNVYQDVPKDYVGLNVSPETFIDVILANSEKTKGKGSGKVLNSGSNDHVFIYFADHGGMGTLNFPDGEMTATQLRLALLHMHSSKQYKKLVMYVEACESGSMFEAYLPNNIDVFVTTAASPDQSSFACYWDDLRQTYLADEYSIGWMEDSDTEDLNNETLQQQYSIVKKRTQDSRVLEYGDLKIGEMKVSEFQGDKKFETEQTRPQYDIIDGVPSHEVPLIILKKQLQAANAKNLSKEAMDIRMQLHKLKSYREFLLNKVQEIVRHSVFNEGQQNYALNKRAKLVDFECHEQLLKYYSKNCFNLSENDYASRYLFVFVNLCEMGIKPKSVKKAMDITCTHPPVYGIH